jgi:serine phosphatase RsbU (regulator of sigma subunit)
MGQAWLPGEDGARLDCSTAYHISEPRLQSFRELSENFRLAPGEGLPGRAWEGRKPIWVSDLSVNPNSPRALSARQVGISAAVGIPVLADGRVVAVIEFFLLDQREEDERAIKLFSAVGAQLGVAIQQERAERELLANQEEFRAARDIQERLFPKGPPALPGYDIAGTSQAASAAGGDYFDYISIGGQKCGVAVGDVTGHGIGPALLMAETRAYLRVLARDREDAGEILSQLNHVLAEDIGAERFITMILVALDCQSGALWYANAGHPAGYVIGADGEVKHRMQRTGVPLGIQPDTQYPAAQRVDLNSGDTVVLLTDGIDEAMAPDDSLFGIERTLEVIRANRQRSAAEMVEVLYGEVSRFTSNAPQLDDATAVILKVK